MVLYRIQSQTLINQFRNLSVNLQVQMAAPVLKFVIDPFGGNINPVDPQWIKLHIKATEEIYKEVYKLDLSVSNAKEIIYNFIILSNKYG